MRRLLVFGIGGFVGKFLADEFNAFGYEIFGTDIVQTPSIPSYAHFQPCDLLEADSVGKLIQEVRPTHIINLAAVSSVALSWKQPQKTIAVNVEGALNILEGLRSCELSPKLLMIGSSEEYAVSDRPIREDFPLEANNPYGLSKMMLERFLALYRRRYHMQIHQVRAFNHTGVGQSGAFVLASWCDRVAEIEASGHPGCIKVGNLGICRDFLDVRDVVRAYRMIIESDDCEAVYNVGSGLAYSLAQLLELIVLFCRQPIKIEVDPALLRPVDNPFICCDNGLIMRKLGWKPEHSLADTLREMFDHSRRKYQTQRNSQ